MPTDPYTATSALPDTIELTAGDIHAVLGIGVRDSASTPAVIDLLVASTATFTVSRYFQAQAGEDLVFQLTEGSGITINDGADTIDVAMTAVQTALLVERYGEFAVFLYDLEVNVDGAADIHTVKRGTVLAKRPVT